MKNPVATYRLQLSPEYTFANLQENLDYLEQLGVSTIYAAPFFQARKGSSHGYDITDPFKINKEIGRLEAFRKIATRLQQKKMSWLQDIVPNHMAFDGNNVWLEDIFELGPESTYYNFFDIDWKTQIGEKVMTPFLGKPLEEVLQEKELQFRYSKRGFSFNYFDHSYPVAARSYKDILVATQDENLLQKFNKFSGERENWQELKEFLVRKVENDPDFKEKILKSLDTINSSEDNLKKILDGQYFLPTHWKKTEKEINYRRFFTINDLICLRMEDREVFDNYHRFILQLCEEGLINGLRIDHVDGLFDPEAYLENLREVLGPDFYVIIEKILEWDEKLPVHWPVQGTSGYGFLAAANQVLTDESKDEIFDKAYSEINPKNSEYHDLVYKQKLFILNERMAGEYSNLWQLALSSSLLEEKYRTEKEKEALGAFLAAFPVYRIYPEDFPLKKKQKSIIETAFQNALEHAPSLENELEAFKSIFLGEAGKGHDEMLYFLQRCQQFTGPLAAKGAEDTSFYIYNKLISHNEVGDSPENFGLDISGFHEKMEKRQNDFPLSINATATHDTKRGEDARMRINVLSELGQEWFEQVDKWREIGQEIRGDREAPDANEEYFIFQMLVGAWPFKGEPEEKLLDRSIAYLQKVLREAKENSSWAAPNEEYEKAVFDYVRNLLKSAEFKNSFYEFQEKIRPYGAIKSLSQLILKSTAPGIPDIYQGTELWDLSYVDPDNRRPVDYGLRKKYLQEITSFSSEDLKDELAVLKNEFADGKIKMFCLYRILKLRNKFHDIFEEGEYIPVEVSEGFSRSILAYARRKGEQYILIVVPILVTKLFGTNMEVKPELQSEIGLTLPEGFPKQWKNIFSEEILDTNDGITIPKLFKDFPVAVLTHSI